MGETYDLGLGLVGLPGDYTSPARFVRCATLRRLTDWSGLTDTAAVARFFGVLGAVAVPYGCVRTDKNEVHATLYTACMDTETLTYHLLTHDALASRSVALAEKLCLGEKCMAF